MPSNRLLFITLCAGTAFAGAAADAAVLYDNGPSTYQVSRYNISAGNYAEDSFTIGAKATADGVDFAAWNFPTSATTTSVDWAIFSGLRAPYAATGPLIASGTATVSSSPILVNTSGYAVNTDSFTITPTLLTSGTYSLNLYNATVGYDINWDVNAGPSTALVHTNFGPFEGYAASNTFQILGAFASAPEPASWALMLVGIGGLGAILRRSRSGAALA